MIKTVRTNYFEKMNICLEAFFISDLPSNMLHIFRSYIIIIIIIEPLPNDHTRCTSTSHKFSLLLFEIDSVFHWPPF
jgi:hypothetical protein